MVDVNKIELIIAKLTAMSDFSLEVKTFMDEMLAGVEKAEKESIESLPVTPAQEKAVAKKAEKEEVVEEKQEVTVASIIEEFGLNDYEEDDLKEELKASGIKFGPRSKKDKLIELVAQAIIDGKISTGDEADEESEQEEPEESKKEPEEVAEVTEPEKEEVAEEKADEDEEVTEEDIREMGEEELTSICEANEIEIPEEVSKLKFKAKRVKALQEFLIEMLSDDEEEETPVESSGEDEEEKEDEFPASQERLDAEEEVEKEVREKIAKKKLTISAIKKELKNYYEGKAECKDCKGCTEEEVIECYILLQKAFVDDEGELHEAEDPYERNEKFFCCGKELVKDPDEKDTMVCEVCGSKYEI